MLPQRVVVKQEVEMGEVFSGIETQNKYAISNEQGQHLLFAYEESGFASRFFLKNNRPLKINFLDQSRQVVMSLERPYFFFLAKHTVNRQTQVIGHIDRKWSFLKKVLEIRASGGQVIMATAKALHPWTFELVMQGQKVGVISKNWSGGKEFFTDADNFLVDFGSISEEFKWLVLAAALAIDLTYFERSK
jgi:uncharacterized protein YxjI